MTDDAESDRITVIFCTGNFSWMGPLEGVICGLGIKTEKTSCSEEVSFVDKLPSIRVFL